MKCSECGKNLNKCFNCGKKFHNKQEIFCFNNHFDSLNCLGYSLFDIKLSKVEELKGKLVCSNCNKSINKCSGCKLKFNIGQEIFCFNNNHFDEKDCIACYLVPEVKLAEVLK